jgi:hypothetical protein
MNEFSAELYRDGNARHVARMAAPADTVARFQKQHGALALRDVGTGREPCRTGAYDDYLC